MSKDKFNQSVSLNTLQSYTILLYMPKHLTLLTQFFLVLWFQVFLAFIINQVPIKEMFFVFKRLLVYKYATVSWFFPCVFLWQLERKYCVSDFL